MDERAKAIARAAWVGIAANAFLAFVKIYIGKISGSMALIADGIDSSTDVVSFVLTLFTAYLIAKPPSARYSFGFMRLETIATKLLSFLIFLGGYQLLMTSVGKIYRGETDIIFTFWLFIVPLLSVVIKFSTAAFQKHCAEKYQSNLLKANAENMQNDMLISLAVLFGLGIAFAFNFTLADAVLAVAVSFWIIWVSVKIFLEASMMVLDNVSDMGIYKSIIDAAHSVEGVSNPHRIRISRLGNLLLITLDIEVEPDICIRDAHALGTKVEQAIHQNLENVYDIVIHFEPLKNIENDEKYGVSSDNL
jgi:cation diffusion facilitator family transporter